MPATTDSSAVLHRERLLPSPGTWIVLLVIGAFLGIILVPLSVPLAITVAAIGMALAVVVGIVTAPVVEVADHQLRLGRAQIDVDLLGEITVLRGEDWARTMGVGFEPLAYHLTRGWIHSGLRAELEDEEDPTTAWVVSCRSPEDLELALRTARSQPAG